MSIAGMTSSWSWSAVAASAAGWSAATRTAGSSSPARSSTRPNGSRCCAPWTSLSCPRWSRASHSRCWKRWRAAWHRSPPTSAPTGRRYAAPAWCSTPRISMDSSGWRCGRCSSFRNSAPSLAAGHAPGRSSATACRTTSTGCWRFIGSCDLLRAPPLPDGRAPLTEFAGAGEAVADSGHRQDEERMRGILLDLPAQVADMDIDHPRLDRVLVAPHMVEDLFAGQHFAGVRSEKREQVKLGVGQQHLTGIVEDAALVEIDDQVLEFQAALVDGFLFLTRLSQMGRDSSQQLARAEGLGDVVVRT